MLYPNSLFYSNACLILIFSGIFCSIVRSLHVCKPYRDDADYYYPARKQISFFFLALSLQFPYVIEPDDPGMWLYVKLVAVIFYPMCFSLLIRRYYRNERLNNSHIRSLYFLVPMLSMLALLCLVLLPGNDLIERFETHITAGFVTLSLLLSIDFLLVSHGCATASTVPS